MSIGSFFAKALDYVSAPLSQPRATFTQGLTAGANAVAATRAGIRAGTESGGKVILTTLGTTAIAATGVLAIGGAAAGAAGVATRGAVLSLAKSAVPKTIGGAVKTVILAPLAVGFLGSSSKVQKAVINAPSDFYNFGKNVGNIVENPSLAAVGETFKENPLIAGGIAAALAALGVKTITGLANIVTTERNTAAIENLTENPAPVIINQLPVQTPSGAEVVATASSPSAPSVKPKKKKKKATKKKAKPKKKAKSKPKKKTRRSKKKKKTIKRKSSK